jgi:hypothetical protein
MCSSISNNSPQNNRLKDRHLDKSDSGIFRRHGGAFQEAPNASRKLFQAAAEGTAIVNIGGVAPLQAVHIKKIGHSPGKFDVPDADIFRVNVGNYEQPGLRGF